MRRAVFIWILASTSNSFAGERKVLFGDRLVQGQRHSPGGVVLLERPKPQLNAIVRPPLSFRDRIIEPLFPEQPLQP